MSQLLLDRSVHLCQISLDKAVQNLFRLAFLEQLVEPPSVHLRFQGFFELRLRNFVSELGFQVCEVISDLEHFSLALPDPVPQVEWHLQQHAFLLLQVSCHLEEQLV